jgi:hypothetical protein
MNFSQIPPPIIYPMKIAGITKLCPPALLYLVVSLIAIVLIAIQNYGNSNIFCVGHLSCNVSSTVLIMVLQLLYVLFWTWVLNLICRAGVPAVSWILVLFPLILFFVLLLAMFFVL